MGEVQIKELNNLFEYAEPDVIRDSILEMFFFYMGKKENYEKRNLGKLVEDIYWLSAFLKESSLQ